MEQSRFQHAYSIATTASKITVVVAGKTNKLCFPLASVEILNLETMEWIIGIKIKLYNNRGLRKLSDFRALLCPTQSQTPLSCPMGTPS